MLDVRCGAGDGVFVDIFMREGGGWVDVGGCGKGGVGVVDCVEDVGCALGEVDGLGLGLGGGGGGGSGGEG